MAALILVEADGYLMQLRDPARTSGIPAIGVSSAGASSPGEDARDALARELKEELELELEHAEFFARFDFDLAGLRLERYFRNYYLVPITRATKARLVLHEGAEMRVFSGEEILQESRVTPYDSFALFLHYARATAGSAGLGRGSPY